MSDLSVAASSSTLTQPAGAVGKKSLAKEDFMKLFITELQYQDPSKPMDSNEMASQLAQFSSMEATVKMSDNMEKLLANQTSTNNLQLLSMLNTKVQTAGNTIALSGGKLSANQFGVATAVDSAVVQISNAAGQTVWQQSLGTLAPGVYSVGWDGKDLLGKPVADGAYTYSISGLQADGAQPVITYKTTATVTGVQFNGGTAQLTLDNFINVGVADVLGVTGNGGGNSTPAPTPTDPVVTASSATATGH